MRSHTGFGRKPLFRSTEFNAEWFLSACGGPVGWWPETEARKMSLAATTVPHSLALMFTKAMRGEGFGFDGDNGYISVPDSPSLRLTASLTIECWLLVSRLPDDRNNWGWGMIFFRGDDRPALDPYFLAVRFEGTVVFHVEDGTSQIAELATLIPIGRFVHVAATLEDRTGEMRIYLDGRVAAQRVTRVRPFGDLHCVKSGGRHRQHPRPSGLTVSGAICRHH